MSVYENRLNLVADAMLTMKNNGIEEKFPISLIDIDCWEWPQGVGLYGLYKYLSLIHISEPTRP